MTMKPIHRIQMSKLPIIFQSSFMSKNLLRTQKFSLSHLNKKPIIPFYQKNQLSTKQFSSNTTNETKQNETEANEPPKTSIQKTESSGGALSTLVIVKEKAEEGISLMYIFGVFFCAIPYCLYLVGSSLFSTSGPDRIRNESFDLLKEDPRVTRILGNDVRTKSVGHHATFIDNDGNERMQVIFEIVGSKGEARVDVEMLKEKEWKMQYCIVSTSFANISIVDNRSMLELSR